MAWRPGVLGHAGLTRVKRRDLGSKKGQDSTEVGPSRLAHGESNQGLGLRADPADPLRPKEGPRRPQVTQHRSGRAHGAPLPRWQRRRHPGSRLRGWRRRLGGRTAFPAWSISMAARRESAAAIRGPLERLLKIASTTPGSSAAGRLAARSPLPALLLLPRGTARLQEDARGHAPPGPGPHPGDLLPGRALLAFLSGSPSKATLMALLPALKPSVAPHGF